MSDRLQVFVSSIMAAEDLSAERQAAIAAINSLQLTVPWAFEFAPAEPEAASNVYLRAVAQSDLVVLIVSRTHSPAVQSELDTAESNSRPILAFVRKAVPTDATESREEVLRWLRPRVKYREFVDLQDLEGAVRESLTSELVRGYRNFRLQRRDLVSIFNYAPSAPTLAVEPASLADLEVVEQVLATELLDWYPEIGSWATRVASEARVNPSQVRVAKVGGEIGGLSVTRDKDANVRKLATFYVRPGHRGEAIGPRLVYEEVVRATRDGVRKAFVTFADELSASLEPLLTRYGFVTEGASGGRYRPGKAEWVMGKTFHYGTVGPGSFREFILDSVVRAHGGTIDESDSAVIKIRLPSRSLFGYSQPSVTRLVISTSPEPESEYERHSEELGDAEWAFFSLYGRPADAAHWSHERSNWIDGEDLRGRFSPIALETPAQDSIICTVKPRYADALIPEAAVPRLFGPERLQIRPDNVYYRTPSLYRGLRRGSRVFFYVSSPSMRLRGSARLRELRVGDPAELVGTYGTMGILKFEDVQRIAERHHGEALALVFDWYEEHKTKLDTRSIANVISSFNPISAKLLSDAEASALVAIGRQG